MEIMSTPVTTLPAEPEVHADIEAGLPKVAVVRHHPDSPLAWARLAEAAWADGNVIESYAFARVGYHRGLDALRKAGWRGRGLVPLSHEPNRGFLLAVAYLARAAQEIGETHEVERLTDFLAECDPRGTSLISD